MCLLALEREGPALAHQALLYPATDVTEAGSDTASARANPNAPFLSAAEMTAYRSCTSAARGPRQPAGVAAAGQVARGPAPALIEVAERDRCTTTGPVRRRPARRRVPVRLTEYAGMPHGFLNFPGLCRGARPALAELIAGQRAALAANPR